MDWSRPLPETRPPPSGAPVLSRPCAGCAVRVLSVCNAISDADLPRLAAIVSDHRAAPRKTFIVEGDPADSLFNITAGAVKIYKGLADGRQQIIGFLFAGDFLGLASSEHFTCSAEAITPVRYCRFPRRKLEALLADFPQLQKRLLAVASNELAAGQDQILLLGRKTARERLGSFLVHLAERTARSGKPAEKLHLPMNRADIADYLGLTIETVSRGFTKLRQDGIIALSTTNEVRILDRDALESLTEGLA